MPAYDVVVIGSGAGGLAAALKMARSGHSVLLLEAMSSFGGYLNPFRRRGYTFDTGVHYVAALGQGETLGRVLDGLGVREAIDFVPLDPDAFDRLVFPDYEFALCAGKERLREKLLAEFPREERGIRRFFVVLDKVVDALAASSAMQQGFLGTLRYLLQHPIMLKYARAPYQTLLDEVAADRRLQAVLAGQAATYGLPPARASVLISMMVLNYYLSGPYYPRGGSGALRDALLEALKNNGAQLQNHARVSRIEKRGQNFMVTIDSGERYSARVVISNAHPALTLGHLVDPQIVPDRVRNKAARLRPSMGAYCAFVGTDLDLPALGITSGNIHHFDSLDVNEVYHALNTTTLLERTPFCFITSPSVKDPQGAHAPAGRHTVEVVTCASYEGLGHWAGLPSRHRGEEYQQIKERVGQRLIDAAEQHIPGLSRRLDVVEYASPLTSESWVNAAQGAMYGPELTPDQMGGGRFAGGVAGVEGLYLAGASVIAGGVSACLASGLMAGIKASDYLAKPT